MHQETVPIQLADIRDDLIRQEETIIFAMIERAQFKQNIPLYQSGAEGLLSEEISTAYGDRSLNYMEHFLHKTEHLHACLGRYSSADEHPFFPDGLPPATLPRKRKPSPLKPNKININDTIMKVYVSKIVPEMCGAGSDEQYGSSSVCDISVLQALSKRIHYGKFVAESKFQAKTTEFTSLIQNNDSDGIMAMLTNEEVERKVIERVLKKASRYGVENDDDGGYKVDPNIIAELYKEYLIPLNKDVQVEYLLQRLDRPTFVAVESARLAGEYHFGDSATPSIAPDVEAVFEAVLKGDVAFGVVEIESGTSGMEKATQQALLKNPLFVNTCFKFESAKGNSRYFVISPTKNRWLVDGSSHVVLFFGVKHEPGSLSNVLQSLNDINLSSIESIPVSSKDYEYVFYCELENEQDSTKLQVALEKLDNITTFVKVVGAY